MRILIVDDDPVIRSLVATVFEGAGHDLEMFGDPVEAWDRLADVDQSTPDIAVLDVIMPRLDGLDLLRRLRSHPYRFDVPVVLLTARGSVDDEVTGWYAGCDAYVRKPFDPGDLAGVVATVAQAGPELRVARRQQRLTRLLGPSVLGL